MISTSQTNTLPLVTMRAVDDAINKINTACGWDYVHSNCLKWSGPIFRNVICKFFNCLLSHKYVPRKMLHGEIRPIVKNLAGSKTESENYRPIMNSSNLFKVFEYSLMPILSRHLKLDCRQFGFRPETGCVSAVLVLKEVIGKYNARKSPVHSAVIDLTKAFDKMNYATLLNKLRNTSLPKQLLDIFEYMYSNTYVSVSFNKVTGDSWKVGNGTRQGSAISPFIFNYYINDMIREIGEMDVGCCLSGIRYNIICYADDVMLLAPSKTGLQSLLNKFEQCLGVLGLFANVSKCAYLTFFRGKHLDRPTNSVQLLGSPLVHEDHCKYLGVIMEEDMSLSKDVERVSKALMKQFHSFYAKFSYLSGEMLHYLFKMYTSSFYGVESWFDFSNLRHFNSLAVAYHMCVKKVAGMMKWDSNHAACDTVGVPIFSHMLAKRLVCCFFRVSNSDSPCLRPLSYYFRYKSCFRKSLIDLFRNKYGIHDVFDNPLCAILARIDYVQKHEPRRR